MCVCVCGEAAASCTLDMIRHRANGLPAFQPGVPKASEKDLSERQHEVSTCHVHPEKSESTHRKRWRTLRACRCCKGTASSEVLQKRLRGSMRVLERGPSSGVTSHFCAPPGFAAFWPNPLSPFLGARRCHQRRTGSSVLVVKGGCLCLLTCDSVRPSGATSAA